MQVSIFCSLVAAEAGAPTSRCGQEAIIAVYEWSAALASLLLEFVRWGNPSTLLQDVVKLAQRGGDIAAVDGGDIGGGFERQRLRQEGLRHVLGGDLAASRLPLM